MKKKEQLKGDKTEVTPLGRPAMKVLGKEWG